VNYGDPDPSLDALVQQEQPSAGQVVAVLHHHGDVLAAGGQLANLEPDQDVDFGVDVSGTRGGKGAEFARPDRLGYGNGGWEHAARWLSDAAFQFGVFVERVLLVVAEDFEYDRLGLDVVDE
jgi:hypothetical protein